MGAQGGTIFAAVAKQAAFGTAISDTTLMKFLPVKAGGLKLTRPSKSSDQLRGTTPRWTRGQNQQGGESLPQDLYYNGLGTELDSAYARATKATASFVIGSTNNKLYFTEDAGQLTATISSATYTARGLAVAIAAAMTSAGDTYSCTYSDVTGLFTITKTDGSPTNFTLDVATTTNAIWSTIGFTAATSGANTYTSDTALHEARTHYFIPGPLGRFSVFYVRTGVNDKINFKENGGSERTATITPGVYTASELCTAVASALDAAGVVSSTTWTVSYVASTGIFTIAVTTLTQLDLLWQTGTNADTSARGLLGFAGVDVTDSSGAMSIAGTIASFGSRHKAGLTIVDHRDIKSNIWDTCFLASLGLTWAEGDPHAPAVVPTFLTRHITPSAPVTPPSGTLNDEPGNPDGTVTLNFTLNGNTQSGHYFSNLALAFTNPFGFKHTVGNTRAVQVVYTGKEALTVNWQWLYEEDTTAPADLYADWISSKATGSMDITQTGLTIRGLVTQSLAISIPSLRALGETVPGEQGPLNQPYAFVAQAPSNGDPMFTITLTNSEHIP